MKIKNMLAAILVEQNKPLIIDEVRLPKTLDFGKFWFGYDTVGSVDPN